MFTLRTLFVVVTVAALAVAAQFTESEWFASAFIGLALLLLLWAVVESAKPFWRAFAIFGIGYFVLTMTLFTAGIVDSLPTTKLVVLLIEKDDLGRTPKSPFEEFPIRENAAQCGIALMLGSLAGAVYQWRTEREQQRIKTG